MSEPIIGIDLGTTNCVVAYTDPGGVTHVIPDETTGSRTVPSAVYFREDGSVLVGESARSSALVEPERVAMLFKRDMGLTREEQEAQQRERKRPPVVVDGKYWSPEQLSALVLRKLADIATRWLNFEVKKAVITVPYYFGEPERVATRSAGEIAGLEVVRIINEPTAAALAHGLDEEGEGGRLLVFDLGGGTLDVTVLSRGTDKAFVVEAGSGDRELGGADFDNAILADMRKTATETTGSKEFEPWALADMSARATQLKEMLSTVDAHTTPLSTGGKPVMYALTRAEFETNLLSSPRVGRDGEEEPSYVERIDDVLHSAMDKAGLSAGDIETVLMVGGSSRIPLFQARVAEVTGATPRLTRSLDEDVARGASMVAARMRGDLDPRAALAQIPEPVDAASHALGIRLIDSATKQLYNEVLIREGSAIPITQTHTFYASSNGQTRLSLTLNEGHERDLDLVRELKRVGGEIGRPVPEDHPFRYEVRYTEEQLIVIEVFDAESDRFVCRLEYDDTGTVDVHAARDAMKSIDVR